MQTHTPTVRRGIGSAIAIMMSIALVGCGSSDQAAEFNVAPATESADAEEIAVDVEPTASDDAAASDTSNGDEAIDNESQDSQDEDFKTDNVGEPLAVDTSRRGEVIMVTTAAGDQVAQVDAELAAGGELVYSFDIEAGQAFLLRQQGNCLFTNERVLSIDLGGVRGVGGSNFLRSAKDGDDCFDATRYDAEESGTVTIEASSFNDEMFGTFSFDIVDVTSQPTVELAFGDSVSQDQPVVGAGVLDFPGDVDVYSFEVRPGQAYLIRQLGCDLANTNIVTLDLSGANSGNVFINTNNCDETDRYEAESGGTVTIHAGAGADNKGTGSYGFELVDLSGSDAIQLQVGDIVDIDSPADGAGQISEPGEVDRYTLDVVEGQTIVITQIGGCVYDSGNILMMEVDGAGANRSIFFHGQDDDDDCFDVARMTAEYDDTLTFEIRDVSNEATGTYRFEVGEGAATEEQADDVLEELDAVEVDDEQLITLDETVLFDFGRADLKPAAVQALAEVADVLGVYIDGEVVITGHTDSVGSDSDNARLSQERADAIVEALVALGVDEDRLTAVGAGESSPIEPNENADGSDNPDGRSANRRVEIRFSTTG